MIKIIRLVITGLFACSVLYHQVMRIVMAYHIGEHDLSSINLSTFQYIGLEGKNKCLL